MLGSGSGPATIRIPNTITTRSLTAQPALFQAIITWGQRSTDRFLVTYLGNNQDANLRALERNECLLVACLFASRIDNVSGSDITLEIKSLLPKVLERKLDLPQKRSGTKVGSVRSVIAVDHLPDFAFPAALYREGAGLGGDVFGIDEKTKPKYFLHGLENRSQQELDLIKLPLGFKICTMSSITADPKINEAAVLLGEALFELFQNTHVHARKRVDGTSIEKSLRMIHVRAIEEDRISLLSADEEDTELAIYLSRVPANAPVNFSHQPAELPAPEDHLRFVAVSVIDSGPGIGPRESWTSGNQSRELNVEDDVHYIKNALAKEGTGLGRPMRGKGLQNVQELMSMLGGFARIGTAKTTASRDFLAHPFVQGEQRDAYWTYRSLVPKVEQSDPEIGASGTVITMVLPIYKLKALRNHD